jgi:hypothetical protein
MLEATMEIKPTIISVSIFFEDYHNLLQEAEEIRKEAEQYKKDGDMGNYKVMIRKYHTYLMTAETIVLAAIKNPTVKA